MQVRYWEELILGSWLELGVVSLCAVTFRVHSDPVCHVPMRGTSFTFVVSPFSSQQM